MLSSRECVELPLRISSKSVCLKPQSLRDSPFPRGVTLPLLLVCECPMDIRIKRSRPSQGGLSQDYILLLKRSASRIIPSLMRSGVMKEKLSLMVLRPPPSVRKNEPATYATPLLSAVS